jgi:dihydrofolate synthase/folylpolyglutamate synthase
MAIHGAGDWILVTGASRDKKADEIIGALAPSFDRIICTAALHKGADPQVIAAAARRGNPKAGIHVAATTADAARLSQEMARRQKRRVYVAGGLFLAVEYATVVKGGRAEDLEFF